MMKDEFLLPSIAVLVTVSIVHTFFPITPIESAV